MLQGRSAMLAKQAVHPRARATPAARRMRSKNPSSSASQVVAAAGNGNGSSSSSSSSANAGGDASSSSSSAASASSSASSSGTTLDPRLSSDEIELWDDNGGPPTPLLVSFSFSDFADFSRRRANVSRLSRKKKNPRRYRLLDLGLFSLFSLTRAFSHTLPHLAPTPIPIPRNQITGHRQLPGPPQEPLAPAAAPALQGAPQRHHPHRLEDGRAPGGLARRHGADGRAALRVQHAGRPDRVGRGAPGVRAQDFDR